MCSSLERRDSFILLLRCCYVLRSLLEEILLRQQKGTIELRLAIFDPRGRMSNVLVGQ